MDHPLVVAITGASGAIYAVRLLEGLLASGGEVHLVISPAGSEVLRTELGVGVDLERFRVEALLPQHQLGHGEPRASALGCAPAGSRRPLAERKTGAGLIYHHYMDWSAGIASGSFLTAGMVICPCSMGTLASVAQGLSSNLIERAAAVHLKERRKLVLVPRETPLGVTHLDNMRRCVEAGAVVLPAMPGFYHQPQTIDDLVNFVVGRIFDQLGLSHHLFRRWGTGTSADDHPL